MKLLVCLLLVALCACQTHPPATVADQGAAPDSGVAATPAPAPDAASDTPPTAPPPTRPPLYLDTPLLKMGEAIGPFRLGMTGEAITKAGYKLDAHPSGQLGDSVKVSGPFTLVFGEDASLTSIELDLTQSSLRYGAGDDHKIITDKTPTDELLKLLACGELEIMEGGNVARCHNGTLFKQAGPILKPSVQVKREATGPKP